MFFLVFGADTYRSRQKLTELRERFWKTRDPSKLNLEHLMWPKDDFQRIHAAVNSPPFLAEKKMIVCEDYLDAPKDIQEKISEMMQKKNDASIVVFFESVEKEKLQKSPLFALLSAQKFSVELAPMTPTEVHRWLVDQLKEKKIRMQSRAMTFFISSLGTDTGTLIHEFEKLSAYTQATGAEEITLDIVSKLITPAQEDSVFVLIDALLGQEPKQALQLFESMVSPENDIYILNLLVKQFRLLAALSTATKAEQPMLAKSLGVHPYVLQKAGQLLRKRSSLNYFECYYKLLSIEEMRKTTRIETKPLLQKFILNFSFTK